MQVNIEAVESNPNIKDGKLLMRISKYVKMVCDEKIEPFILLEKECNDVTDKQKYYKHKLKARAQKRSQEIGKRPVKFFDNERCGDKVTGIVEKNCIRLI